MQGFSRVAIAEMPSNISDLVIPEPSEVRTTPAASCDEDDYHPPSAQKPTSDEEVPTVGLKPFNSRLRGMRKEKIAPEDDDVSSEEYDGSDQESSVENDDDAGCAESVGPSREISPEIEDDGHSSDDAIPARAATKKQRLQITSGEEHIQTESVQESVASKRRNKKTWQLLRSINITNESQTDIHTELLNAARTDFTSTGTPEPPGVYRIIVLFSWSYVLLNIMYMYCRHDHGPPTSRRRSSSIQPGAMV
jgi:hypothetical protein